MKSASIVTLQDIILNIQDKLCNLPSASLWNTQYDQHQQQDPKHDLIGQLICDWLTVIGWYLPEQLVVPLQCILTNMFEPELFLQSWSVSTLSHGQYLTCGLSYPGLNTWLEGVSAQCGLQLRGESGNISIDSVHDHSSSIVHPTNVLKHTNLVWNNFSTMIITITFLSDLRI